MNAAAARRRGRDRGEIDRRVRATVDMEIVLAATKLAAEAPCDLRTARKALEQGTDGLRPLTRDRVVRAARRLGFSLPMPTS